jgi:hypothetical protein
MGDKKALFLDKKKQQKKYITNAADALLVHTDFK